MAAGRASNRLRNPEFSRKRVLKMDVSDLERVFYLLTHFIKMFLLQNAKRRTADACQEEEKNTVE